MKYGLISKPQQVTKMQLNDVVQKQKQNVLPVSEAIGHIYCLWSILLENIFNLLFEINEIHSNIKWLFYILGGMIKKGLASERSEPLHVFWLEFTK